MRVRLSRVAVAAATTSLAACASSARTVPARSSASLSYEETTIAAVHASFRDGSLTCRALVQQYIARIDAYDKKGPAINAIVVVSPDAL